MVLPPLSILNHTKLPALLASVIKRLSRGPQRGEVGDEVRNERLAARSTRTMGVLTSYSFTDVRLNIEQSQLITDIY